MHVTKPIQLFATTLALVLGTAAFAQDTTTTPPPAAPTEAPATAPAAAPAEGAAPDGLSMGVVEGEEGGIGSTYTEAVHGDWEQRCVRTEDGANPCQLYQLLRDADNNPVAEFTILGLPKGQQAAAGATVIAPLETLLTESLTLQVDTAKAKKYPFSWCSQIGCISRIGFTAAEVDGFRKGSKATVTIVPVVAPDQKVVVNLSLKGFTAGYDAVNKSNGN